MSYYKELIIFDLDDTLINTSHVYWMARKNFVDEIVHRIEISREELIDRFEYHDTNNMREHKYSPYRYKISMKDTYRDIENQFGSSITDEAKNEINHCIEYWGHSIVRKVPDLLEGAKEILDWCNTYFYVVLLTRGEDKFQKEKLRKLDLHKYFKDVQVVDNKDASVFQNLINRLDFSCEDTWIIGDSLKSDINPGLEIGANCILYAYNHPEYHWQQDFAHPISSRYHKVDTLLEITRILESKSYVHLTPNRTANQ